MAVTYALYTANASAAIASEAVKDPGQSASGNVPHDKMGIMYDEASHSYLLNSAVAGVLQALLDRNADIVSGVFKNGRNTTLFGHVYKIWHYPEGDVDIEGYRCRGFSASSIDAPGLRDFGGIGMNACLVRGRWRITASDVGDGHSFKLLGWMHSATTDDLSIPGSWEPISGNAN